MSHMNTIEYTLDVVPWLLVDFPCMCYMLNFSVVAFNLGYLPKGDKSVITEIRSTIQALESAISLVRPKGVITIVSYVGHQGGR